MRRSPATHPARVGDVKAAQVGWGSTGAGSRFYFPFSCQALTDRLSPFPQLLLCVPKGLSSNVHREVYYPRDQADVVSDEKLPIAVGQCTHVRASGVAIAGGPLVTNALANAYLSHSRNQASKIPTQAFR